MFSNTAFTKESVKFPALGAIIYQAHVLVQELESINDKEYPLEACKIRNVFLCIASRILCQLWKLYDPDDPYGIRKDPTSLRVRALGKVIQELYSYIRYLRASSHHQSPPALQLALTQLTNLYFPKEVNGEPLCLIRPQWKYNLTYIPITLYLRNIISISTLDPEGELEAKNSDELLIALWKEWRKKLSSRDQEKTDEIPPQQLAILSFAGLDTHDLLLYPILAHELSHFIDYSYPKPLNLKIADEHAHIYLKDVQEILDRAGNNNPERVEHTYRTLVEQTFVCIRELLADLLSVRMLGFSFFVAQAEFLKTLAPWSESIITSSGYPDIKFRVSQMYKHITADDNPNSIFKFLDGSLEGGHSDKALRLKTYLEEWGKYLAEVAEPGKNGSDLHRDLKELVMRAVKNSLDGINKVARDVIPDATYASLTTRFFHRITCLEQDLPPSCPNESRSCFAEIMSASWAYQVLYGNQRENEKNTSKEQYDEYKKTCRLIVKAIELIPASQNLLKVEPDKQEDGTVVNEEELNERGALSAPSIRLRLELPIGHPSRLSVVPLNPDAVQAASLDVRLGNWFSVARPTRIGSIQLGKEADERLLMTIGRELVFIPADKTFLIHPGDFVLGTTLEFIALPDDLMAFVEGRSGPGRKGLIVATATQVAPGFHGVIILELANTGRVPLEVTPGIAIAQLVFQVMTRRLPREDLYHGKYHCQIWP